ncbi:hypothetical protein T484DRAFT_3143249 [Baffinella frigidus]|nr:hypothetical protein T484DRAFT_3143249 [Cryptophyta sp. CCMP2293]
MPRPGRRGPKRRLRGEPAAPGSAPLRRGPSPDSGMVRDEILAFPDGGCARPPRGWGCRGGGRAGGASGRGETSRRTPPPALEGVHLGGVLRRVGWRQRQPRPHGCGLGRRAWQPCSAPPHAVRRVGPPPLPGALGAPPAPGVGGPRQSRACPREFLLPPPPPAAGRKAPRRREWLHGHRIPRRSRAHSPQVICVFCTREGFGFGLLVV